MEISNIAIFLVSILIGFGFGYFLSKIISPKSKNYGIVHFSLGKNGIPDLLFEFTKKIEDIPNHKIIHFDVDLESNLNYANTIRFNSEDLHDI